MLEFEGTQKRWPTIEEVLAKKSWTEDDITVLIEYQDELDDKTLAKLGLKPEVTKK
jgi:hypothetical protein